MYKNTQTHTHTHTYILFPAQFVSKLFACTCTFTVRKNLFELQSRYMVESRISYNLRICLDSMGLVLYGLRRYANDVYT